METAQPLATAGTEKLSAEQRNTLIALLERFLSSDDLSRTDPLYRAGMKVVETGDRYATGLHNGTLLSFTVWRQDKVPRQYHLEIARWALESGMDPDRPHGDTGSSTPLKELERGKNQDPEMLTLFRQYSRSNPVSPASASASSVVSSSFRATEASGQGPVQVTDQGTEPGSSGLLQTKEQ